MAEGVGTGAGFGMTVGFGVAFTTGCDLGAGAGGVGAGGLMGNKLTLKTSGVCGWLGCSKKNAAISTMCAISAAITQGRALRQEDWGKSKFSEAKASAAIKIEGNVNACRRGSAFR
jgi:hypothetical protein